MKWILPLFFMSVATAGIPPTATNKWSGHECDDKKVDATVATWAATSCGQRVVDATYQQKRGPLADGKCEVYGSVWCGDKKPTTTQSTQAGQPSNCHPPFGGVAEQYLNPAAMVFRDENCQSRNAGEYWPLTDPRSYTDLRYEQEGEKEPWKNDGISSLYVKDGWRISIFENVNYGGKAWTICGPVEMMNLRSFGNDTVSSMIVKQVEATSPGCEPGSINDHYIGDPLPPAPADCYAPFSGMDSRYANPGAMLFENESCSGRGDGEYWPLTDANTYPNLVDNVKNDWASALFVKAGWRLEIFAHINYNRNQGESDGKAWTICGPVALADLRAFGNDTVSSMIVSTGDSLQCEAGHVYEGSVTFNTLGQILFGQ